MKIIVFICLLIISNTAVSELPERCNNFKNLVTKSEQGLCTDIEDAVKGAQIMVESSCRNNAVSHMGARYATQFMPPTERWVLQLDPVSKALPAGSAERGARMQAWYLCYLHHNVSRLMPNTVCDHLSIMLAAYHSGLGNINKAKSGSWSKVRQRLGRYGKQYPLSIWKWVNDFHRASWPGSVICY